MLSIRAMAAELGVSKSQVARDKDAGMPMTSVSAAQAWREAQHDVSRTVQGRIDRPASSAAAARAPAAAEPDGDEDDTPRATDTAAYRAARTEREQIRRDRERMELERERGQLVDRAEVERLRFTEFRSLRDALANLGPRVAPLVAIESDQLVCEQIYTEELEKVLTAFADQVLTRGAMQDVDDDDEDDDEGGLD